MPRRRVRNGSGAEAKRKPPTSAAGTPVRANQPTTGKSSSLRLNQARLKFPNNWATVRMGIASRTPKAATRSGNKTAAPPKPATAAKTEPTKAAPASRIRFATDMKESIPRAADRNRLHGSREVFFRSRLESARIRRSSFRRFADRGEDAMEHG